MADEWKNFICKSIQEEDFSNVFKHFRASFYHDEPSQIVLGTSEARENDLDNLIRKLLEENMSFMVICKATEKIAGIVVITHFDVNKKFPEFIEKSPTSRIMSSCIIQLTNFVNIYEKFGVEQYGDIFFISVLEEFRKVGLGTEMFRRVIEKLKDMKYSVITCIFSNPFARRIGEKFGFVEVARLRFIDAVDNDGKLLVPNAQGDQFLNVTVLDCRRKSD